jgi:hypothetical protein
MYKFEIKVENTALDNYLLYPNIVQVFPNESIYIGDDIIHNDRQLSEIEYPELEGYVEIQYSKLQKNMCFKYIYYNKQSNQYKVSNGSTIRKITRKCLYVGWGYKTWCVFKYSNNIKQIKNRFFITQQTLNKFINKI